MSSHNMIPYSTATLAQNTGLHRKAYLCYLEGLLSGLSSWGGSENSSSAKQSSGDDRCLRPQGTSQDWEQDERSGDDPHSHPSSGPRPLQKKSDVHIVD
jgi:hypothetical protein